VKELILTDLGRLYKSKEEGELPADFLDVAVAVELDTRHLQKDFDDQKR
jgi:hypothetical protein